MGLLFGKRAGKLNLRIYEVTNNRRVVGETMYAPAGRPKEAIELFLADRMRVWAANGDGYMHVSAYFRFFESQGALHKPLNSHVIPRAHTRVPSHALSPTPGGSAALS